MSVSEWIALGILFLTLTPGASRRQSGRSFSSRSLGLIFAASVIAIFGAAFFSSYFLYENWTKGALTQFFLPPHQGWGYFYSTAGYKFFAPWLISLLAAIVLGRLGEVLNRRWGERFFETEEIWIMRLSFFLVGYPGLWFYTIFLLFVGAGLSAAYGVLAKGRAPLYYLWLPLAIATILIQGWVIPFQILNFFKL